MSTTTPPRPRVLIVGGGWAGYELATSLSRTKYAITIAAPERTSASTPLLASAAVGLFTFSLAEEHIPTGNCHYLKSTVERIDFDSRTAKCRMVLPSHGLSAGDELIDVPYDILILAPGCAPNTFDTPGVSEHAIFIKTVRDARAVREQLFNRLDLACLPGTSDERQRELLHVAIVGGGPTGIELCAELSDLAHGPLTQLYPALAAKITICIYDVADNILSAFDKDLWTYANDQLVARAGVDISTGTHITRVDAEAMYTKEHGRVPYGMLIWATGNKAQPLIEHLAVAKREKVHRILTDTRLRVFLPDPDNDIRPGSRFYDDVYALGDAADIVGESLPTTAEVALQKARYLSRCLNAGFDRPFRYKDMPLTSYIGSHDGVTSQGGGRTGRTAWLAWRRGTLYWSRTRRVKVMIILTWIVNYLFERGISKS